MDFFLGLALGTIVGVFIGVAAAIGAARRNTKVGTPSASHNSARDEICPLCLGDGEWENVANSIVDTCPLCKGTGKLSPVA
jgi:DnaJ-class molecular chaperone